MQTLFFGPGCYTPPTCSYSSLERSGNSISLPSLMGLPHPLSRTLACRVSLIPIPRLPIPEFSIARWPDEHFCPLTQWTVPGKPL